MNRRDMLRLVALSPAAALVGTDTSAFIWPRTLEWSPLSPEIMPLPYNDPTSGFIEIMQQLQCEMHDLMGLHPHYIESVS